MSEILSNQLHIAMEDDGRENRQIEHRSEVLLDTSDTENPELVSSD